MGEVTVNERVKGGAKKTESLGRTLREHPDRVAAAWRRLQYAKVSGKREAPSNLLETVIESFVREVGKSLEGHPRSAWARTQGVLRLSPERGILPLYAEFTTLRQCLSDAAEALGASVRERALVECAVDEAAQSACALTEQMMDAAAPGPEVPFGGLVVEFYERASAARVGAPATATASAH